MSFFQSSLAKVAAIFLLSIPSTWALSFEQISQLAPLKYGPLSTTAGNPSVTAQNVFVASEGSPLRILARLSVNPGEVITECRFSAPAVQNAATPTVYSTKLPSGLSLRVNSTIAQTSKSLEGAGGYAAAETPLYHCELAGVPLPYLTQATNNTFYTLTAVTASGRTESATIALDIRSALQISIPTQLLLLGQAVNTAATVSGYLAAEQPYPFVTRRNFSEARRACVLAAGEALPAGLSIDSASCSLRGTPSVASSMKSVRIVVTSTSNRTAETRLAYRVDDPAVVNSTTANSVIRFNPGFYEAQVNSTISVWHVALPLISTELITSCTLAAGSPAGVVAQLQPDQKSCRIGGSPTAAFPRAFVTMNISTNRSRSFTGNIELSVIPKLAITYPQIRGTASQSLSFRPTISGLQGPTEIFGACRLQGETPLPAGLKLDAATCEISGTPTTAVPTGSVTRDVVFYSNRAADRWAATTLSFNILPALTIGFTANPVAFLEGASQSVDAVIPLLSGESILTCSGAPSLPAGLRFGVELTAGPRYQKFCKVYGTSSTPTVRASHPISVRTSLGRIASGSFNLEVRPLNSAVTINDLFLGSPQVSGSSLSVSILSNVSRASFMAFTTTANCGGTLNWQTYNPVTSITLPLAAGTQTVYARFKDAWENLSACVSNPVTFTATPPSISFISPSQTLRQGTSASLMVTASGSLPLQYQWKKNSANIGGATASTLTLASFQSTDAGNYSVTVTNPYGQVTSSSATLAFTSPPSITTQPQSRTLGEGSSLSLSVVATAPGTLSYQWMKDGFDIANATASTFVIPSARITDTGYYQVRVTSTLNALPSTVTSASANIVVNAAAPSITQQPSAQSGLLGSSVTFSVQAAGSAPLTYQWKKGSTNLTDSAGKISGANSPNLVIMSLVAADAGTYSVTVTNSSGNITSSAVALSVNSALTITSQPTASSVNLGGSLAFQVTAVGSGTLTYQWKKGSTNLSDISGRISGATTRTLILSNCITGDAANYSVVISNGTTPVTSASVALTVLPALAYSNPAATYSAGAEITPNIPMNPASSISTYNISPAPPAGLNFNTTTGWLTGRPSALQSPTTYTITAGTSAVTVSIAVSPSNLVSFSYDPASVTVRPNVSVSMRPVLQGGDATVSFASSPLLASTIPGISLNPSTGVISGQATASWTTMTYAITAHSLAGDKVASISLFPASTSGSPRLRIYDGATLVGGTTSTAIQFGTITSAATKVITLRNEGNAPLILGQASLATPYQNNTYGYYISSGITVSTLAAGASTTITLTLGYISGGPTSTTPINSATGVQSNSLIIPSNDTSFSQGQYLTALQGRIQNAFDLSFQAAGSSIVSGGTIDFGSTTLIGSTLLRLMSASPQRNFGDTTYSLTVSARILGRNSAFTVSPSSFQLTNTSTPQSLTLSFNSTGRPLGTYRDKLVIGFCGNGAASSTCTLYTFNLVASILSGAPTSQAFAVFLKGREIASNFDIFLGSTPPGRVIGDTIQVKNTSGVTLRLLKNSAGKTVHSLSASEFPAVQQLPETDWPPNQTRDLNIAFAGSNQIGSKRSSSLVLIYQNAAAATSKGYFFINLAGISTSTSGEPSGGSLIAQANDRVVIPGQANEVDLRSAKYQDPSPTTQITLANGGSSPVYITQATLAQTSPHIQMSGFSPVTLNQGAATNFNLSLDTTSSGIQSAQVTISYRVGAPDAAVQNLTFRAGGVIWSTAAEVITPRPLCDLNPCTPQINPHFPLFGTEELAMAKAITEAQFSVLIPQLTRAESEVTLDTALNSAGSTDLAQRFFKLVMASNRSGQSQGALLLAKNWANSLFASRGGASPEAIRQSLFMECFSLLSQSLNFMSDDTYGTARSQLILAFTNVKELIPFTRVFSAYLLMRGVENFGGLNGFGRYLLRSTLVKAYLSTNPPMADAEKILNPILSSIDDPIVKAPIVQLLVSQYPELYYALRTQGGN